MTEFWESSFQDKQTMWGFEPAEAAVSTATFFQSQGLKNILIPGYGYGRNAKVFTDRGFAVTGIEISETAIGIAKRHYGDSIHVYHGSVTDMPFDHQTYDGIFCHALIHLLDVTQRRKLLQDCYRQLRPDGYMVFVAISKNTPTFGEGVEISKDRFETRHGVQLFYYDAASVEKEFGSYGLIEAVEIDEPATPTGGKPSQKFWQITCRKK
ncbi:class I SAM-dependent methyltransferase [Rufibacter quisquiliarum]|uniref:SAM-dependent methyltransferase n=1 Tax=Rufibacter quisquiliarum TaxID=1549639 RepID=A0A839GVS6_9BACT|nr:class I SAM-dependent methyltransferase [Rufibacter quisquiliarum]MBA9079575.1 SAM-dependent methyltransferase [Rufibacter quisquiliarum]